MYNSLFFKPKKLEKDFNKAKIECYSYLKKLKFNSKNNSKNAIKYLKKKDIFTSNFNSLYGYSIYINALDKHGTGLDIGCSYGIKTLLLSNLIDTKILGVDISKSVINDARDLVKNNNENNKIFFRVSNNLNNIKQNFDWITAMGLLSNCSDSNLKLILKNCYKLLNPNGLFLLHCGSNSLNPYEMNNTMSYHKDIEIGKGNSSKPQGMIFRDRLSYIKKTYNFNDNISHELALNLCYHDRKQINKFIKQYINYKKMPNSKFKLYSRDKVPVHLNGIPARNFNNPSKIKTMLKKLNFKVFFKKHHPSYDIVNIWEEKKYIKNCQSFFIVAKK